MFMVVHHQRDLIVLVLHNMYIRNLVIIYQDLQEVRQMMEQK